MIMRVIQQGIFEIRNQLEPSTVEASAEMP